MTAALWIEYALDMRDAETIVERNADEIEGREWAACGEAMEAAEHGLTVAELREEYAMQDRDARISGTYKALRAMAIADMEHPQ